MEIFSLLWVLLSSTGLEPQKAPNDEIKTHHGQEHASMNGLGGFREQVASPWCWKNELGKGAGGEAERDRPWRARYGC